MYSMTHNLVTNTSGEFRETLHLKDIPKDIQQKICEAAEPVVLEYLKQFPVTPLSIVYAFQFSIGVSPEDASKTIVAMK